MLELLALPGWRTPPTPIDAWVSHLEAHGGPVVLTREFAGASWLEIGSMRIRGYAMHAGSHVEAINFELPEADSALGLRAIEEAAKALGWEIHFDVDEDEGDDPEVE